MGIDPQDISLPPQVPLGSHERRFKVLSLNCWGLKFLSRNRRERIAAIAEFIVSECSANERRFSITSEVEEPQKSYPLGAESGTYDLICLQELWCEEDWATISSRAREVGLNHGRWFYSGAFGAGLAILTPHRLVASSMFPYPLNGNPIHVAEGDWHVGKGAGSVVISLAVPSSSSDPSLPSSFTTVELEVINTHFYAPFGNEGDGIEEWPRAHRIAQTWELGKMVRNAAERGRGVIVTGDLNSPPHSHVIRFFQAYSRLNDSFSVLNPSAPHPDIRSPADAIHLNGITCDSPLNFYSKFKSFPEWVRREGGKRLDYIMYRNSSLFVQKNTCAAGSVHIEPKSTRVVLTETIPGTAGMSYSDHFGIETIFGISLQSVSSSDTKDAFPGGEQVPSSESQSGPGRPIPLSPELISISLDALITSFSSCLRAAKRQMNLFYLCLFLVPCLAVGSSFQPRKEANWFFILLAIALGWGGTTMLYVGLLGGNWEQRALRNVIAEMELEMQRLERAREEANQDVRTFGSRIWA